MTKEEIQAIKVAQEKQNKQRILEKEIALNELKRKGLSNTGLFKIIKDNLRFNR